MKKIVFIFLLAALFTWQWQLSSCKNSVQAKNNSDSNYHIYYYKLTDSLAAQLNRLDSMAGSGESVSALQAQYRNCRYLYKKIEPFTEYYFQGVAKRINGPALPDVKTEDGVAWPPHGFQVIEELLFDNYSAAAQPDLHAEIAALVNDLLFTRNYLADITVSTYHVQELLHHQLIRIAVMGITGFDSPVSFASLPEARYALYGMQSIIKLGSSEYGQADSLILKAVNYLQIHTDFDSFDRLEFLTTYLMPLSKVIPQPVRKKAAPEDRPLKPFAGSLADLLSGTGFNADYYSPYSIARSNEAKINLGKTLFYDTRLSASGKISCASCHKPELMFTDGKIKAANIVHGGELQRNTPTLFYAAIQSHQFYDMRSVSLEDQANEVMHNTDEFNLPSVIVARKITADTTYLALFRKAFKLEGDSIRNFEVRNALAAYVRSLTPFSSRVDAFMRGDRLALNANEKRGFNLFAGKAKCATCHFIPLYNGNIPPWYTRSESEIIGVPREAVLQHGRIDPDSGRYLINRMAELGFAFKTPTVRNVEKTAPYMHNGAYKTLEDVIEFYHKGGGVGIGIDLPLQTLPFDSLQLSASEQQDIISFMKALTEQKKGF